MIVFDCIIVFSGDCLDLLRREWVGKEGGEEVGDKMWRWGGEVKRKGVGGDGR